MREIEVDGDTISEVVAYLNGHKTVPAKRMADAVLRLLNRHYQDAAALEAAREALDRETSLKGGVEHQRDALWAELEAAREDSARLDWLASEAATLWGSRDRGGYELPYFDITSGRECCDPSDLRSAIDKARSTPTEAAGREEH